MEYEEYLRRLPKAELHCHVSGSVRPATVAELARKAGVRLPTENVEDLYEYDDLGGFLEVYGLVGAVLTTREDFTRIAYESLEDGVRLGNLRYREMFFNPSLHMRHGLAYRDIVDGLIEGMTAAAAEFGVRSRLIPAIYRQDDAATVRHMLDEILAHRRDEIVGLGMDGDELRDPPERFAEAFRDAGRAGLRLTAHTGHDGPAAFIATCVDVLGCERIDHGYHVLDDSSLLERLRDEGIVFTCATPTPPLCGWPAELSQSPVRTMVDAGLRVTLNSDDPPMLHTDIGTEYVKFCTAFGHGSERAREFTLTALDAAWLDQDDKRSLRREFERDIERLGEQLAAS